MNGPMDLLLIISIGICTIQLIPRLVEELSSTFDTFVDCLRRLIFLLNLRFKEFLESGKHLNESFSFIQSSPCVTVSHIDGGWKNVACTKNMSYACSQNRSKWTLIIWIKVETVSSTELSLTYTYFHLFQKALGACKLEMHGHLCSQHTVRI